MTVPVGDRKAFYSSSVSPLSDSSGTASNSPGADSRSSAKTQGHPTQFIWGVTAWFDRRACHTCPARAQP